MPRRLSASKLVVQGCTAKCTLNPENLGPEKHEIVHALYEQGVNDFKMEEQLRAVGLTLSHGAIGRHRKNHLVNESETMDEDLAGLSDIEAIELALQRGQKNIKNWKLTPSEYIKFMELKYRLTQGSTNDAMFAALASAGAEEDEDEGPSAEPEELEEA